MIGIVCPVIQNPDVASGWETWDVPPYVIIVDNTPQASWKQLCHDRGWTHFGMAENLGVATSWNLGAQWAFQDRCTHVALISSSVLWEAGKLTWFVTEAFEHYGDPRRGLLTDGAFHASIWSRDVFREIGWFDENFWPAYMEDIDWLRRCEIAGIHVPDERRQSSWQPDRYSPSMMPKIPLPGVCENAVSLKGGAVHVDFARQERMYQKKWGGTKGREVYDRPYGLYLPLSACPIVRHI